MHEEGTFYEDNILEIEEQETLESPRVALVIPSGSHVHANMMMATMVMAMHSILNGVRLCVINPQSSLVMKGREDGVTAALDTDPDYIMFLDSDMVVPPDTLLRLLSHKTDIVGALYPKRRPPYQVTGENADGSPLDLGNGTGLVAADRLPTGCLLIDVRVFDVMDKPWFPVTWLPGADTWQGEDYGFCDKAMEIGIQPMADLDLTLEVQHLGVLAVGSQLPKGVEG